ncbi:820_t:CDS:2, partial [Funneliformis caledonium]
MFRYIHDKASENLPPVLNNHKTATLILKALKGDRDMPALVFEWNPAGFNDVATAPGLRNGIVGQSKTTIVTNLTTNGAKNYNDVVFTFPNGYSIGEWRKRIVTNIPCINLAQFSILIAKGTGVPNVINSVTRINRITEHDTDTAIPSTAFDLEEFS